MTRLTPLRRRRSMAAAILLGAGLLLPSAVPASASISYFSEMTGDQAVPGPGDPDANGLAQISIDVANGAACVSWDIVDLDPATSAHVQSGAVGVSGPVVVTLPTPDAEGLGGDCVNGLDGATLQAIVDDPDAYYVAVYTAQSENPAIRGQLGEPIEHFQLQIFAIACPEATPIEPFEGSPEGCRPIIRPEHAPTLPDGYSWAVEPLIAAFDVEIDDGSAILTIADGEWEGGGTCNSVTLLCSAGGSFRWDLLLSGDTIVTQTGIPDGYGLAGAVLFEGLDGEVVPLAAAGTVAFDSTGTDSLTLALFDLPATAPGPVATATIPPTTTSLAPETDLPPSSGLGAFLATVALILVAVLATMRRVSRRR